MMKMLLVFGVILFNCLPGLSQKEFAPIGAEWYYDKNISYNPPIMGYTKLTCIKDTVIENKKVKVIEVLDVINDTTQSIGGYEYIYQSGDTIRYWKNNQFNMLYNFAMQNGDSILLYSEMLNQCTENDPYGWNKVDSTFTKEFNGIELKSYTSIPINNSVWGFLEYTSEIFGNTYFLIPQNTSCVNDGIWYGPLRCYSDPINGVIITHPTLKCDSTTTYPVSVSLLKNSNLFSIYPNPVECNLYLNYSSNFIAGVEFGILIVNTMGSVVKTCKTDTNFINVSDLPIGSYFLILTQNKKPTFYEKFIKI